MKNSAQVLESAHVRPVSPVSDYVRLTKPRISLMVMLTAAVGYFMASRGGLDVPGLLHTMLGTLLVSGSANTLNQVLERTPDAQMRRTANRPLPTGRIGVEAAVVFATVIGLGGILYCAAFLNMTVALIAAATLGSYAFVYTPLKRRTTLNTLVGAVPGALPPLGGWAAASGGLDRNGWSLFLIVFLWQVPHFLAIAWLLRHEYARAGFRMLPVEDPGGVRTGLQILVSGLALIPVSLAPTLLGFTGGVYFVGALTLSVVYAGFGAAMALRPHTLRARWLFLVSILYLPALLLVMMVDKLPA